MAIPCRTVSSSGSIHLMDEDMERNTAAAVWHRNACHTQVLFLQGDFWDFFSRYCIPHCFICRLSDFTVSEDAGIESRIVATSALAAGRSKHSNLDLIDYSAIDLIHNLAFKAFKRKVLIIELKPVCLGSRFTEYRSGSRHFTEPDRDPAFAKSGSNADRGEFSESKSNPDREKKS